MCFWDRLHSFRLLVIVVAHDVRIIYWKPCIWQVLSEGYRTSIARLTSRNQPLTIWSPLFGLYAGSAEISFLLILVTFSALYTSSYIPAQIVESFCSCNWWDSIANCSSTLAFTDFDIFWCWKVPFFMETQFSASSSTVRDRSELFCWLTIRENSHNARTPPITISSEAVSAAVFPSSSKQSRIGAQSTDNVLIMPQICLPCQQLLFIESNSVEKPWRPGSRGTDVNQFSNQSLIFLTFRYLSNQCNKSLTKPTSSWWNWSGCQSW